MFSNTKLWQFQRLLKIQEATNSGGQVQTIQPKIIPLQKKWKI
jgi:hypothetical protein